jgi:DNA-binding beta-propeller fold protein YncE
MHRLLFRLRPLAVALLSAAVLPTASAAPDVRIERAWQYEHRSAVDGTKSEIVAYDDTTDTLWVAGVTGVDVLARVSGQRVAHIPVGQFGAVNSVAVKNGLAALAIESTVDRTLPGVVLFVDTATRLQNGAPVAVGALPDMLTFTPDGSRVLVANEGTPNPRPAPAGQSTADPVGSVSIIDVASRGVVTLPITPDIPGYASLRLFPATMSAYDPEPESIAVDRTGRFAWVALQEANGIAVLDLQALRFDRIFSLGLKDFSAPGNEIDPSDQDGKVDFVGVPVKGLYQPDGIASYAYRGQTFFVLANEGDARDNGEGDSEDERRGGRGSGAARLTDDPRLSRLNLSNIDSVRGGALVAFGGHSVSIRDAGGAIVWDSGSLLDREADRLGLYDDTRSDNKGIEPEGVALLEVEGRVLAFVGLERAKRSAFAVFDVTDPSAVEYIDMIVSPAATVNDVAPEGLVAFRAGGRTWVALAQESSDTTTLYEVQVSRRP